MIDRKIKVVVIDDEECIRDSFKWHLEEEGFQVVTSECPTGCAVYNGHHCDRDQPCGDILFVDYNMERMTGLDFIAQMAERGCKGVRKNMYLMSGNVLAIDRQKAAQVGANILEKPISLETLDEIMARTFSD